jgi:predicted nucleotidyltransferase
MNAQELLRQDFRRNLYKYVNGEFLSWWDPLISMIVPSTPFLHRAKGICRQYKETFYPLPEEISSNHVKIELYQGKNSHVSKMMTFLSDLKDDLFGAYLHGSLGTYEEVPFSDFDALVIIKDEVFEKPDRLARLALKLNSAQAIMFDFDPLQHHGWFVLTEADLKSHPEDYFPIELFRYAKSLLPDQGLELRIQTQDSSKSIRQSFDNLIQSAAKLIARNKSRKTLYQLKILLSQFMLLPTLYVEIRDRKGIYKKFSFEAARGDFDVESWLIMEEVSLIREQWFFEISPFWRGWITKPTKMSRSIVRTYLPRIPDGIEMKLTEEFYRRMSHLTGLMKRKVQ